ncbi:hybrid sensor histidine kinase/response regulator transcription factor [Sediminicola luteus]|uniref:histidine kinase n=1 Tax=Sediminicola luteus TaxID=319238 RepID=A0A2A4GFA8_9FLAO|nr:two-component regulator propeller domain-containing protein [Sediminicola luteus]PCE66704.1 hypothetical protein B7P33_05280 [Sediminicola luteus]
MTRLRALLWLFYIYPLFLLAQPSKSQDFRVNNLNIEHGLSHNYVSAIYQDNRGYIWFGTKDGLNRYDGYNILSFWSENDNYNGGLNTLIVGIVESASNNGLWVGARNALKFYDFTTETLQEIKLPKPLKGPLLGLFLTSQNKLFVYTTKQLIAITQNKSGTAVAQPFDFEYERHPAEKSENIATISCIGDQLWVGYESGLLQGLSLDDLSTPFIQQKDIADPVKVISSASNDHIWFLKRSGKLFYWSNGSFHLPKFKYIPLEGGNAMYINQENDKTHLWLCSEENGFSSLGFSLEKEHEEATQHLFQNSGNQYFLPDNKIRSIFQDPTGVLWVGTRGNGVMQITFDSAPFHWNHDSKHRQQLLDVNSLVEDVHGNLWIGTNHGLLQANGLQDPELVQEGKTIFDIEPTPSGFFYTSDYGNGIQGHTQQGEVLFSLNTGNSGLSSNTITSFTTSKAGDIYMGAMGGGVDVLPNSDIGISNPQINELNLGAIANNPKFKQSRKVLLTDKENQLWACTTRDGVYRHDLNTGNTFHYSSHIELGALGTDHFTAIHEDDKGHIWFGSIKGLLKYDRSQDKIEHYKPNHPLPDKNIIGITSDQKGRLWVLSRNWLTQIDLIQGNQKNYRIQNTVTDQLFTHNPIFRDSKGLIWVGSQTKGYFYLDPDKLTTLGSYPKVGITQIKVSGQALPIRPKSKFGLSQSIGTTTSLTLKYNQNNLTLDFASLYFLNPQEVRYKCILEGAQENWQFLDAQNPSVNYFDLQPGSYEFKVTASNPDGVWNPEVKSLRIDIFPPWWLTWWAYALYGILTLIAVYLSYVYIKKWFGLKNQLVQEHLEKEGIIKLNQSKIRFFTNISHEFKTPLTLILGPIEELIRTQPETKGSDQIGIIHRNAKRLQRLIDQLLDFRKMEQDRLPVQRQDLDMVGFLREIADYFKEEAHQQGIDFRVQLPSSPLWVSMDKDMLDKIAFNLLSNAFKFTPKGGTIRLSLSILENILELQVQDNGVGMDQDRQERIFDRFYHAPNSSSGTGIGLSFVKNLVDLLEGSIHLKSKKGKGSTFRVSLPLVKAQKETPSPKPLDQPQGSTAPIQKAFDNTAKPSDFPLILVVEDNTDLRRFIIRCITSTYRILEAENGQQGLELAKEHHPDLIISDVMMPKMDGFEFCKQLRQDPEISHVPILLLTALGSVDKQLIGYKLGADDYIAKPFDPELLRVRLANLIQSRKELKNSFAKTVNLDPKEITHASYDEKLLTKALAIVEQRASDPSLTVEELSNELGLSRVHVFRKFKALTGQGPKEFIQTIRLKQAAKLLQSGKLNVSDISFKVGFQNPVSFGRAFKRQFGLSPLAYREAHNQE